jgi:predicted DNA-binding transcriptional regulator YafY
MCRLLSGWICPAAITIPQSVAFAKSREIASKSVYTRRAADPYHAVCQRGNWYFIGHCYERGKPRLFAFSRIRKAGLCIISMEI